MGRFEEEDVPEEPTAPVPSIREERDLRLTGEVVDATTAALGELCRVLGAEPLAIGDAAAAAAASAWSLLVADPSPFCCGWACCCCLARAAAAADPGGGGMGILDAVAVEEGEEGGSGLFSDILLR